MKKLVAGLLMLVIVIAAGLYYFTGTPYYSLYLISKAVREHNRELFYHHFDLDRVIENSAAHLTDKLPGGLQVFSKQASEKLLPVLAPVLKSRIDERLNEPDKAPITKMVYDSTRYEKESAYVTLRDPANGATTIVVMAPLPERRWKIVDLDLSKANLGISSEEADKKLDKLLAPR